MIGVYRHYKGQLYLKLGATRHSETQQEDVVYRCLYPNNVSDLWTRPRSMFEETVLGENGSAAPRFQHLGNVRLSHHAERERLLMFGFDTWHDGKNPDEFIASYAHAPSERLGVRYVFDTPDGTPVAKLNTLAFSSALCGIASVATDPSWRRKGYAAILLRAVMAMKQDFDGVQKFVLFSEINPDYYTSLGFKPLPKQYQRFLPSVCMSTAPLTDPESSYTVMYF